METGDGSELAVHAQESAAADIPTAGSGRAYMLARLAEERRSRAAREAAERLAGEVDAALTPLARDATRQVGTEPPAPLLTAAYLVRRDEADAFGARVRELASRHPDLRLLCTGPWPPYHFVPAMKRPSPAEACHRG